MKLLDLVTAPWAIQPEKLLEMQAIYATHLRGEKIDIEAVEARLGRPLASDQQEYSVRQGGVAVLPIEGVLSPKANMFTRISGGASAQMLQLQLESAMADSRVRSIVLAIDSPGGSVFGMHELADAVRSFSDMKPIVTVSEGQLASAAYLIGAAANEVYISGPAVHVGSIGVVASHEFRPSFSGTKITEITAGRYKRIASSNAPLSDEGRAYIQQQLDQLYSAFVDAVASYRGVDSQTVLERMADGHTFIGQQSIDAGLVDGFSTVDAMVEQLASDPMRYAKRRGATLKPLPAGAPGKGTQAVSDAAGAAADDAKQPDAAGARAEGDLPPNLKGAITMADTLTREALDKEHPDLVAQIRAQAIAEGASAERDRVTSVRAQSLPGHEALIERLAADGKTSGPEAAMAVMAAERGLRQAAAQAHADDAPAAAPAAPQADVKPVTAAAENRAAGKQAVALFRSFQGEKA